MNKNRKQDCHQFAPTDFSGRANERAMPKWLKFFSNFFFFAVTAFALVTAVLACIFIRTNVKGPSMQPLINSNWSETNQVEDTVLINRLKKGERGDIIVVDRTDENEGRYVIKRLIAVGGDYIAIVPIKNESGIETGKYCINLIKKGEDTPVIVDDSLNDMKKTYEKFCALKSKEGFKFKNIGGVDYLFIDEGKIFYLGDNRNISRDCAEYGPVEEKKVVGKVVLIIEHGQSVFRECFKYFLGQIFG